MSRVSVFMPDRPERLIAAERRKTALSLACLPNRLADARPDFFLSIIPASRKALPGRPAG
jgi:hypothetical protein